MANRNKTTEPEQEMPEEIEAEERGLVTVVPAAAPAHHVVTGMAALARMTDAEFEQTMLVIEQGQKRIREFQSRVMTKGEDYGTVPNVSKPFLHLPGAEKLALLYGMAARQEAERLIGEKRKVVVDNVTVEEWVSPPLAYHVKTYIHLGDFDGPIVAMGYGEASSWEEKYRYRFAKAKCPKCGREGLIKGKADGKLKGKWWCPLREGGCNSTFESADPAIEAPGKVENPDPFSLAETIVQMAAKRSFVAAIRRATGTSGIFTQDEDSPSVIEQAGGTAAIEAAEEAEARPQITPVAVDPEVERGGKSTVATPEQIRALSKVSRERDLGPEKIASVIERLGFGAITFTADDRVKQGKELLAWLPANLTADQMGSLLQSLATGEVPEAEA